VIRRALISLLPHRLDQGDTAELVDHLGELRHRLVVGLAALVPSFVLAFAFHERLIELLTRPLPAGERLVTLGVTEAFTTAVKVSLAAGVALALPVLLWQTWGFLAPAVDLSTRRALSRLVIVGTALFAAGVAFSYAVVLPASVEFLTTFDDHLYLEQVRASYYLAFAATVLLASGLAFELPIFVLGLVRIGVLTTAGLRRNRRVAAALLVALAVLLPTVDPVSLALEVAPLLVLYEGSIWLAVALERRWARSPAAPAVETG
jgi:sec-independent protein translocase protein TatC